LKEHRKTIYNRLRRIEGQIQGLQRMVEREAPCVDVLVQLAAATAALKKTGNAIIQNYLMRCIDESSDEPGNTLDDFQKALTRYIEMS
jgi:DNA-binding FrmR family transcriptional regulator